MTAETPIKPLAESELEFQGKTIRIVALADPIQYVVVASFCQAFGIDVAAERRRLGRKSWFEEETAALHYDESTFQVDTENLWRRVKGSSRLNRNKLAIVQTIAVWREQLAQQQDKTRRKILSDDIVLDLAHIGVDRHERVTDPTGHLRDTDRDRARGLDARALREVEVHGVVLHLERPRVRVVHDELRSTTEPGVDG